ncbi:saccharopine dehydrogenase family protein [Paenibacillus sp. MBLB4367]|uniref:saccharopine dehydrogenase family protein n=1 Tax=Paenibacillus sp. MBLB4367 TaxID=3384767 RepID=UPI0039082BAC
MKEDIIVIGGYGHVGQMICESLGEIYPGKVYAAGRNLKRAEAFCQTTNGRVKPLQADISKPVDLSFFERARLIVMCLDQTDTSFVKACIRSGTHYVDISANGAFLSQAESLHKAAEDARATAVLSVGLAPGLTNLLAVQASRWMDETKTIEIGIMLGLGDKHGRAAIEWTVDNLNARYAIMQNNRSVTAYSFTKGKRMDFGSDLSRKKAFLFPFADQQSLPRTLNVPSVATRLCLDSGMATSFLAVLKASGLFRMLSVAWFRQAVIRSFGLLSFGDDRYAVKVDAKGRRGSEEIEAELTVHGHHEADMTAKIAAHISDTVYRSELPFGVYHIEQLFRLCDIYAIIRQATFAEAKINGRAVDMDGTASYSP